MNTRYSCGPDVIDEALRKMKANNRISNQAVFDGDAGHGLRKEVSYRDMDFLEYLGYCNETKIVDEALEFLKQSKLVNEDASYDSALFMKHRVDVKRRFDADWGTITPAMERLFYMLSSVKRPKRILAVGIFWANALSWNIGSSCGEGKVYDSERIYGLDIDPEAVAKAQVNLNKLKSSEHISLFTKDGIKFALETQDSYDYVYLDVGISQIEKSLNYDILKNLYDKIEPGGWVLTHDTTHPFFKKDFKKYLEFVHDTSFFSNSICFDIDQYGLELSVKK